MKPKPQTGESTTCLALCLLACAGCAHAPALQPPACEHPAPITGRFDRYVPTFWIQFPNDEVAAAVAGEYGLRVAFDGSRIVSFPVTIDPVLLAKMRCDSRVPFIDYSQQLRHVVP